MTEAPGEFDVALLVARVFEELGIEYALGGSLASSLQGEPRSTNDVDFAVRLEPRHVSALADRLGDEFVVDRGGLRDAVARKGSSNIFFLPTVLKIDLFVRGGDPFDESELARRRRIEIRDGESLFVASPEDNLLRKLLWFRMGGEVSDRQWRDVLGILRIAAGSLDDSYVTDWSTKLGVADLLARARAQT